MSKAKDYIGQRFHYLTVLRRAENNRRGDTQWWVRCDCGTERIVTVYDLMRKKHPTKSCGCKRGALLSARQTRHGMSRHPAFGVWHAMKQRCEDRNHRAYHNYGARGITVCERWSHSFEAFWSDMGPSYRQGLDLDRADNNAGYNPENCRWVERKVNTRNTRTNRVIDTPYGRMCVGELSERTGIGMTTLLYRLNHGWPTESLCVQPDFRNVCTISGIVVRGAGSRCGTLEQEKHAS